MGSTKLANHRPATFLLSICHKSFCICQRWIYTKTLSYIVARAIYTSLVISYRSFVFTNVGYTSKLYHISELLSSHVLTFFWMCQMVTLLSYYKQNNFHQSFKLGDKLDSLDDIMLLNLDISFTLNTNNIMLFPLEIKIF